MYHKTLKAFSNLFIALKSETIAENIVDLYFITIRFCQIKSYIKAHDYYLKLSAANTYTNDQSKKTVNKHSDQSFRNYTQTFKRMITLAQQYFPNDPSKSVLM